MRPLPDRRRGRPAYTLLELIIAVAICVLFLGALFAAMQLQLRHVQAGRDVTEHSGLARAIFARMTSDIVHSITPAAPAFFNSIPSTSGGAGSGSGSGNSGSPSGSTSATPSSMFRFDFGIRGEQNKLTLFSCGLPPETNPQRREAGGDARFITYWLARGGLARVEQKRVTGDDAGQLPAAGSADEAAFVIAEEVKGLEFRYFDRTGWNSTWDGTDTGPDWLTLVGPPRAIEITLTMAMPFEFGRANIKPELRVFRHVVSIPTAPR